MNPWKANLLLFAMSILVQSSDNKRKQSPQQNKKLKLPKMILSQNLLHFNEAYLMPRDSVKMKTIHKQMSKIIGPKNLFPNESPVQVFRHRETNAVLWEDSQNLIDNYWKQQIGLSLQKQEEEKSRGLYDVISIWVDCGPTALPDEVLPFLKELMFPVCDMEDVYKPLKLAVYFDAVNAIGKLIERGVDVNEPYPFEDDWHWPAMLHYAVFAGCEATCRFLLVKGANINYRAPRGYQWSPMMHAIYEKELGIIKLLARYGAEITNGDRDHIALEGFTSKEVKDWTMENY